MARESKIIELLRSFGHNEYRKLGDFVRSPFHNKSESLVHLYDYFGKFSKDFDGLDINYEEIADLVLPDEKFNESRVRSLISNFVKLIEAFLIYTTFEKYTTYQKTLLLNTLNSRNLPKSFKAALNETIEVQKKENNRDEDYYYSQIYIEVESFNYILERSTSVDVEDFAKINENINLFFILTKLNLLHFMTFQMQSNSDTHHRIWLMNEVIEYIEENISWISKEHPIIYMKYLILMTIIKPWEESSFRSLKRFVLNNHDRFRKEVLGYVFTALTNYCMVRCNGGDMGFKTERFKVYKLMEDYEILSREKYINFVEFLNSIISALAVNKVNWAEKFFQKYQDRILPPLRETTLAIAKAQILYHKGQFEEALKILNNVNINDHSFYLRTKKLLVMIYYDMGNTEPILYIIDAARHYLKRNTKISKINAELFLKFFNYMGKIVYLDPNQKMKLRDIKYKLIKDDIVSSKEWLLTKIEELEKVR